ncbi:MAG: Gfo/Idh/MocA family protein [Acidimicrobiia bacterium]
MDQVRYGIIGTGMMGVEHIANLKALDGAAVVAAADPNPESRTAADSALGGSATLFTDHHELLASGLCEAVVIAVPNDCHRDVLLDVAAHDVHFLVEKPFCVDVAQCREVIAATAGSDKVKWMGLEYRYKPPLARLLRHVSGGAVGAVRMVAIREHRFPFLGKVDHWNRFRRRSGGTLVEKCCHFFDLMTLIAGSEPVRVMASGSQDVNHLEEVYADGMSDIIDNAYVVVEYANGVRTVLDLCMFAESGPWEQEVAVTGDTGKVEAFVPIEAGDGFGMVRIGSRAEGVLIEEEARDDSIAHVGMHSGASYLEHIDFLAAIRAGTPAKVTLEDGLTSVAVGQAAHLSIDEGRIVEMSEILEAE